MSDALHDACVASPFDKLRVTPLNAQRQFTSSVSLSLSKAKRATEL